MLLQGDAKVIWGFPGGGTIQVSNKGVVSHEFFPELKVKTFRGGTVAKGPLFACFGFHQVAC